MASEINSIAIVGMGNVGFSLFNGMNRVGVNVSQVYTKNDDCILLLKEQYKTVQLIDDLSDIQADLCLVCVSDDAIDEVIRAISADVSVAHTSGGTRLDDIQRKSNIGVFYPLQTITSNRQIDFKTVPFLIESSDIDLQNKLMDLALKISDNAQIIDSEKRRKIHLAAIFINNFVNHQIYLAEQLAKEFDFDKNLLKPLLLETVDKAISEGAYHSQTGPGRRGDVNVISTQEAMLPKDFQEIYHILTESIIRTYNG